jgi:cytochrome bd-type quinol oxidase subunit 2
MKSFMLYQLLKYNDKILYRLLLIVAVCTILLHIWTTIYPFGINGFFNYHGFNPITLIMPTLEAVLLQLVLVLCCILKFRLTFLYAVILNADLFLRNALIGYPLLMLLSGNASIQSKVSVCLSLTEFLIGIIILIRILFDLPKHKRVKDYQ